jgi:hypothetical protein
MRLSGVFFAVLLALVGCKTPLPIPEPVTPVAPASGTILRSGVVQFVWKSNESERYELQIASDAKLKTVVLDRIVSAESVWAAPGADGRYFWHVRPLSADSVWGSWTQLDSFVIERFRVVTTVKTQGYPHDIDVHGTRAYIADGQAGLAIFDVSNPEQPVFLGSKMDSLNEAWGVVSGDSYAYVAYGYTKLAAMDIRRPDSIRIVGQLTYPQPAYGYDVALKDSWVYVAAGAQFIVVNVSDPRYLNVTYQGFYPRDCHGVAVQGRYAYVACEQLGIASWLVDTVPPVQEGSLDSPSNARGIAVQGSYVYVADGRDGLVIADVSDPANIRRVGSVSLKGYANAVSVRDTLAVLTCGSGGTSIVNVARPDSPSVVAMLPSNYAMGVCVLGQYVLVCDRDAGLTVIKQEE